MNCTICKHTQKKNNKMFSKIKQEKDIICFIIQGYSQNALKSHILIECKISTYTENCSKSSHVKIPKEEDLMYFRSRQHY